MIEDPNVGQNASSWCKASCFHMVTWLGFTNKMVANALISEPTVYNNFRTYTALRQENMGQVCCHRPIVWFVLQRGTDGFSADRWAALDSEICCLFAGWNCKYFVIKDLDLCWNDMILVKAICSRFCQHYYQTFDSNRLTIARAHELQGLSFEIPSSPKQGACEIVVRSITSPKLPKWGA